MEESKERVKLPKYTLSEELFNSISHGIGAIFGIFVFIFSIVIWNNSSDRDYYKLSAILIYGLSLILLYTISCIYHSLAKNKGKKVLRILDHDMVFLLIAGTYTPFSLVCLRESYFYNISLGWVLFAIVWTLVVVGIVFNSINIEKYNILSTILYIVIGWSIMIFVYPFIEYLSLHKFGMLAFSALLIGGILYTIGSVLYGIGAKVKGMHSVFHFFVLAASVFQFISIYFGILME